MARLALYKLGPLLYNNWTVIYVAYILEHYFFNCQNRFRFFLSYI